jgi:hypothetical protein
VSALPSRPKPAYMPGCETCDRRRTFDAGPACADHRSDAERAWYSDIALIAAVPHVMYPEPTLF